MSIEQRKSISLERDQNGIVIALIISGTRYRKYRGSFELPEIIAGNIDLDDLDFTIIVDFVNNGQMGVVFRAIQNTKGGQWEVVVMVRHMADGWDKLKNMHMYADEVEKAVKQREHSCQDLTFLINDKKPDYILVAYTILTEGTTVGELLNDALEKSRKFLPLLI